MINLFIAIPAFGGKVHARFTSSLISLSNLLNKEKVNHTIEFLTTESLISRGRNSMIAEFYSNPNYSHILFLDSDLIFNPKAVLVMLSRKKEIIGCPYPKKIYNLEKLSKLLSEDTDIDTIFKEKAGLITDINYNLEDLEANPETDLCILAKDIPTGFMLLKRSAITAMMINYTNRQYRNNIAGMKSNNDHYYFDLFGTGVVDGIYLSEDYFFCYLARKIGLECWLETGFTFGHIGSNTFYGNLHEQLVKYGTDDNLNLDKNILNDHNNESDSK